MEDHSQGGGLPPRVVGPWMGERKGKGREWSSGTGPCRNLWPCPVTPVPVREVHESKYLEVIRRKGNYRLGRLVFEMVGLEVNDGVKKDDSWIGMNGKKESWDGAMDGGL